MPGQALVAAEYRAAMATMSASLHSSSVMIAERLMMDQLELEASFANDGASCRSMGEDLRGDDTDGSAGSQVTHGQQ